MHDSEAIALRLRNHAAQLATMVETACEKRIDFTVSDAEKQTISDAMGFTNVHPVDFVRLGEDRWLLVARVFTSVSEG